MVVRRAIGELLPNQAHYFNADTLYKRFTPAGPDHAQVAASAGMADYFDTLHGHHNLPGTTPAEKMSAVHDLMRDHETLLLQPLLDYLSDKNSVRLLGPKTAENRAPTVAVDTYQNAEALAAKLAPHGIMAGGGDFYAVRALEAHGIDPNQGVLRLSFVHYTSEDEVSHLIETLEKVL